jgi:Zn-dependent peptidase ImmA (M78 family)
LSLFIPDVGPTVAPISPPPPRSDVALLARLHELEHLLADARDQSVQIYARLESTEADCLALAGRVLIAERGRDEAVRAMKEVEWEREVALRALGEVRSREEVERALKEERREVGEVEGMVWKDEQPGWAYVDRLLGRG